MKGDERNAIINIFGTYITHIGGDYCYSLKHRRRCSNNRLWRCNCMCGNYNFNNKSDHQKKKEMKGRVLRKLRLFLFYAKFTSAIMRNR